ncbi:hypothetical protein CHS0354_007199 [Potamilus streckersoni]|uniref:DUF7886 domain-containing protein n=1 Tax=Potamilus streckersoni TaxID=2493646 RepID=A0AAE0T6H2_9BIVA|nr:hypothetical protein CHS0354_007199 [Potamilus streckersoni]
MDEATQESVMKKKLQSFLSEMLKMATVKGFRYFVMYIRGKEEIVLSVVNEQQVPSNTFCIDNSVPNKGRRKSRVDILSASESFSSTNLPYDQRSLLLSQRSQMVLSTHGVSGVGLPPASPSEAEFNVDESSTLFLVAGYARYICPYVWVRSNHERLVKLTGDCQREKDNPLRLKSTLKWKDRDVYIWDLVAEVVKLCTYPAPTNPFAIDFDYFSQLPLPERVLSTAAMVQFLQKILIGTPEEKQYAGQVFEELQLITKHHYQALKELIKQGGLPIVYQQQQQQQISRDSQGRQLTTQRSRSTSYNAPQSVSNTGPSYGYGTASMF